MIWFFPSPLAGEGGRRFADRVRGVGSYGLHETLFSRAAFTPHPAAKRGHPLPHGERGKAKPRSHPTPVPAHESPSLRTGRSASLLCRRSGTTARAARRAEQLRRAGERELRQVGRE